MNFHYLCRQFELGELQTATPLKPGTAAHVWRLGTDRGEFLVRTLSSKEQGEREWAVTRHLLSRGFGDFPPILLTADGAPFLEWEGQLYQVQRLLIGAMPDPTVPGEAKAIAKMVKGLVGALADCPAVEGIDRFDLTEAWERGRKFWPLLETPYSPEQAEREIACCCAIPERERQVIHGDLGPWNMLRCRDGGLVAIDFGESRMGDPYFDFASALGGIINHTPAERRETVCREFLVELGCDRLRLMEQLRMWVWRGLVQWALLAGNGVPGAKMAARFINALNWAEEHLSEL